MIGDDIRNAFIKYFESKNHKHIRSSPIIPYQDPTILFTNAGMNQFKDYFLGNQEPQFKTAVTSQKVLRAGGKHNDLDNVGKTPRHHTFFEMLGNFSFGDYFKKEAIEFAWEFLTKKLLISEEKLAVSIFNDDDEAYNIWANTIHIPKDKIVRLGEKDNFWSMGNTGPCGPCSEIHFDLLGLQNGISTQESLKSDDDRYLEIWNLVFMQFNRSENGTLSSLPKPSIDTGMGLERITSVVNGHYSNYDTSFFTPIIKEISKKANYTYGTSKSNDESCCVIADHIRAASFLISDGVLPSNEGKGYVLRRIIRRAARYGKLLGFKPGFFSNLTKIFVPLMETAYPELKESSKHIQKILTQEEHRFSATLNQGLKLLYEIVERDSSTTTKNVAGAEIFKLYDTYGFPKDLAEDILTENGLTFDETSFDLAMEEQKTRAKAASETDNIDLRIEKVYPDLAEKTQGNQFVGYNQLEIQTEILAFIKEGKQVSEVNQGDTFEILLQETPFYAEGGGQVGDKGTLFNDQFRMQILDTNRPIENLIVSKATLIETTMEKLSLKETSKVTASVNPVLRNHTELNHTTTHLLQAALRNVLGSHVKQAGSLVDPNRLRFDFNHYAPVTKAQLLDIESIVNENIRKNDSVFDQQMSYGAAEKTGAMAIFGEKYGDFVRVVSAGEFSIELCGGCHTGRTGNIGVFKIISESSIASGVRRIEAVTGAKALDWIQIQLTTFEQIGAELKVTPQDSAKRVHKLNELLKEKEIIIETLKTKTEKYIAEKILCQVELIHDMNVLIHMISEKIDLKSQADLIRKKLKTGMVLLGCVENKKISIVIAITKELTQKYHAGKLIRSLAPYVEGKGGGKPDIAQCGGNYPAGWEKFKAEFKILIQ